MSKNTEKFSLLLWLVFIETLVKSLVFSAILRFQMFLDT